MNKGDNTRYTRPDSQLTSMKSSQNSLATDLSRNRQVLMDSNEQETGDIGIQQLPRDKEQAFIEHHLLHCPC